MAPPSSRMSPEQSVSDALMERFLNRLDVVTERVDVVEKNADKYMDRVHALEDLCHTMKLAVARLDKQTQLPQGDLPLENFISQGPAAESTAQYTNILDLPAPATPSPAEFATSISRLNLLEKGAALRRQQEEKESSIVQLPLLTTVKSQHGSVEQIHRGQEEFHDLLGTPRTTPLGTPRAIHTDESPINEPLWGKSFLTNVPKIQQKMDLVEQDLTRLHETDTALIKMVSQMQQHAGGHQEQI